MRIRILPSAKRDLHRGFGFYERQEAGIGSYFLDSLYSDIDSISVFAGIHRRVGELFRFKSKRFPFWIYYRLETGTAYVVAVLDARRAPWRIRRRERIEQGEPPDKDSADDPSS
jgi:plasmid stabilization system protein ParE